MQVKEHPLNGLSIISDRPRSLQSLSTITSRGRDVKLTKGLPVFYLWCVLLFRDSSMVLLTLSSLCPLRFVVAVVFIISNAIVTSVSVWNLSIVEGSMRFCEL